MQSYQIRAYQCDVGSLVARAGDTWQVSTNRDGANFLVLATSSGQERGGNSSGCGGLNAWWAHVGGCLADTLAGAVFLDDVELLGGVASSVVVVVFVVDVVHVVMADVGALQGLVALDFTLSAPEDLGVGVGVGQHGLASAANWVASNRL